MSPPYVPSEAFKANVAAAFRECGEQRRTLASLHALAVQARDARTSADRRAAIDALERAALALGGTP